MSYTDGESSYTNTDTGVDAADDAKVKGNTKSANTSQLTGDADDDTSNDTRKLDRQLLDQFAVRSGKKPHDGATKENSTALSDPTNTFEEQLERWQEGLKTEYAREQSEVNAYAGRGKFAIALTEASTGGMTSLETNKPTALSTLFLKEGVLKSELIHAQNITEKIQEFAGAGVHCSAYFVSGLFDNLPIFMRKCNLVKSNKNKDVVITLENTVKLNPQVAKIFGIREQVINLRKNQTFDEKSALKVLDSQFSTAQKKIVCKNFITFYHAGDLDYHKYFENMREYILNNKLIESLHAEKVTFNDARNVALLKLAIDFNDAAKINALEDSLPTAEIGVGDLTLKERLLVSVYDQGLGFIVDTPLKSANPELITAFVAQSNCRGERVLHISKTQKSARNVLKYLKKHELDDLYVDAFTSLDDNKNFAKKITSIYESSDGVQPSYDLRISMELEDLRQKIGANFDLIHQRKKPWGVSYYDTINKTMPNLAAEDIGVRFSQDTCINVKDQFPAFKDNFEELLNVNEEIFTSKSDTSGAIDWTLAVIESVQKAESVLESADRLLNTSLPQLKKEVAQITASVQIPDPEDMTKLNRIVQLLSAIRQTLDLFTNDIFIRDLQPFISVTAPKSSQNKSLGFLERKRLLKESKTLLRPGQKVSNMHEKLLEIQDQKVLWSAICKSMNDSGKDSELLWENFVPSLPSSIPTAHNLASLVVNDIQNVQEAFSGVVELEDLMSADFTTLESRLREVADNAKLIRLLPEHTSAVNFFVNEGLDEFAKKICKRRIQKRDLLSTFERTWFESAKEQMLESHTVYNEITSAKLQQLVDKFTELDKQHVQLLSAPVKFIKNMRLQEQVAAFSCLEASNYLEFAKHYCSAFGTSWKNIPAILRADEVVDTLIIEDVENISPHALVLCIVKAKRVVILTDLHATSSRCVQALAKILPVFELDSRTSLRDVRLTRFIKDQGYSRVFIDNTELKAGGCVKYSYLKNSETLDTICETEVNFVCDYIVEYCQRSTGSLNVGTLTQKFAKRIKDELKVRLQNDSTIAKSMIVFERSGNFIDIACIDNASFLPVDDVLLVVSIAKTPQNKVLYDFGSLSVKSGFSDLVALLSSVNKNFQICTSVEANDLKRNNLMTSGQRLLFDLLSFTKSVSSDEVDANKIKNHLGIDVLELDGITINKPTREYMKSSFAITGPTLEQSSIVDYLAGQVSGQDYEVQIDYNFSDTFDRKIPLTVFSKSSNKAVAVLIDDTIFNGVKSLRQKLRFRKEELEFLGWRVVRVWSKGVVDNPKYEATKILDAFVDEHLKTPAKSRGTGKITARDAQILENRPPHWG
ncbi:MAG: hypothetical protein LBP35_03270 [Candidatus Ancillula trichonymphae]|jgi:hypothetical protein|nr:hypothetical protein [Candidatus Ancillula trichonymphae]